MKKLIRILVMLLGCSALADVGRDLNLLPPHQAMDRVQCIYIPLSGQDDKLSISESTDEFYVLIPSAGTKKMYSFEEFSFEADVVMSASADGLSSQKNRLNGKFKIESQNFGILISGEVEVLNPYLGVSEILKHSVPSLYVEDFFYLKNRPRNPESPLFKMDFKQGVDKIGGGLSCFLETRFIDREWRRVDGGKGPNKLIREVKSKLIRRG